MHHNIPHLSNKVRSPELIILISLQLMHLHQPIQLLFVVPQITGFNFSPQNFHFHLIQKIVSQILVYPGYRIASRNFCYQIVYPDIGYLIDFRKIGHWVDCRDFAIWKLSIRMLDFIEIVSRRPHSSSITLFQAK